MQGAGFRPALPGEQPSKPAAAKAFGNEIGVRGGPSFSAPLFLQGQEKSNDGKIWKNGPKGRISPFGRNDNREQDSSPRSE